MALVKDEPVVVLDGLNQTAVFGIEDAQLFSMQFYGTGSLSVVFGFSNDGENWTDGGLVPVNTTTQTSSMTVSGVHGMIYQNQAVRATTKYVRARVATYTSGSTNLKFVSFRYGT